MYKEYFGLSETPFSLTPDPRYLFMSERHREGLAHLLYGVQQSGGFVQLTGEIGSGKTTLCRCLTKQLPADTDVALLLNPRLSAIELLATVCDELRIPYPAATDSIKILVDALNSYLLEAHAQGRRTVLIIDEAQNLREDVLEQVRLLTNLETAREKLLQIILIGQPELLSILDSKKLRQLSQRITARYHLLALSRHETYAYIKHRLLVAGRRDPLFTRRALRLVYRLSGGMPRMINIICDRALLGAYARDKRLIGAGIVRRASKEARGLKPHSRLSRLAWTFGVVMLAMLAIGGALFLNPTGRSIFRRNDERMISTAPATSAESVSVSSSTGHEPKGEGPQPMQGSDEPSLSGAETERNAEAVQEMVATVQPKSDSASDRVQTTPRLVDILADPDLRGSPSSSFITLYALWGAHYTMTPWDLGCKVGSEQGFACLFQNGGWPKLRRLDLPAILELKSPKGIQSRVTLVGLGKDTARIAIGDRQYTFPLSEINTVWEGSFILIWKPPFTPRKLSNGASGDDVKWVRQALDKWEGKGSSSPVPGSYDEDLKRRVMAFQRDQSLIPDGYVGSETLVRLALALEGPDSPSLSRHPR
jgi:general secretion pathway protein A